MAPGGASRFRVLRRARRRLRCARRGHRWVERFDADGRIVVACLRCGRVKRRRVG